MKQSDHRSARPCPLDAGQTLIELAIGITLLGLIAAAAAFSVHSLLRDRRLHSAATEVARFLDATAYRAVALRSEIGVRFLADPPMLLAAEDTEPRDTPTRFDALSELSGANSQRLQLPRGIEYSAAFALSSAAGPPGATLRLYPTGSASPGRIRLVNGAGDTCTITQSLRGARRVECDA